jgi:hypothetical protein
MVPVFLFQVATTCFPTKSRVINLHSPCICNMWNDHCHRVSTHLQLINVITVFVRKSPSTIEVSVTLPSLVRDVVVRWSEMWSPVDILRVPFLPVTLNPLMPSGHYVPPGLTFSRYCVLPTQCVCVFCTGLFETIVGVLTTVIHNTLEIGVCSCTDG